MTPHEFTGDALLKALDKGELTLAPATGTTLAGMVKKSDQPGCIAFTPAGCDAWIDIPTSMIEKAIHIGERRCKDHSHVVVQITLKQPKDAEAQLLAKLLMASAPRAAVESPLHSHEARRPGHVRHQEQGPGSGSGGGIDCDEISRLLLRACLERTPLSSSACVFLYESVYRICGVFGGGSGSYAPAIE